MSPTHHFSALNIHSSASFSFADDMSDCCLLNLPASINLSLKQLRLVMDTNHEDCNSVIKKIDCFNLHGYDKTHALIFVDIEIMF